jgi:YD repeat-containing protein
MVHFHYDGAGRLVDVTDRAGQVTHFAYHGDSHFLASITDALGHVAATIEYDDLGRAVRRTDARGLLTDASGLGKRRWSSPIGSSGPARTRRSNGRRRNRLVGHLLEMPENVRLMMPLKVGLRHSTLVVFVRYEVRPGPRHQPFWAQIPLNPRVTDRSTGRRRV